MAEDTYNKTSEPPEVGGSFFPSALSGRAQWIVWKREYDEGRGSWAKVPRSPKTGRKCDPTDPGNWADLDTALSAADGFGCSGVGFSLAGDRSITCIDLDHVLNGGEVEEEFRWIVDGANTFTEVSPSGDGLHVWFACPKPDGSDRVRGQRGTPGERVEMYDHNRFMTVTGRPYGEPRELSGDASGMLGMVYGRYLQPQARPTAGSATGARLATGEEEILSRIMRSEQAEKFDALYYRGDLSAYGGDHSRADSALCSILAFWCKRDQTLVDSLFRRSALMRPKWDRRTGDTTYGAMTVAKACEMVPDIASRSDGRNVGAPGATEGTRGEAAGGKREHGGGRAPRHRQMADKLLLDHGAAFIGGVPCVRSGMAYAGGVDEVLRVMDGDFPDSKKSDRAEAYELMRLEAPRLEQANQRYVAFRNGILDVETGELVPEGSGPFAICNVIPHDWNPSAECPELDAALGKMADGDAATLMNIEEMAGHCLMRTADLAFVFVLVGSGSNGKSVLVRTLRGALGDGNVTTLQPDALDSRFQTECIVGKLAILSDDASSNTITPGVAASMKRISAGNQIHTDLKGIRGIDFVPYSTLVMSYNRFPKVRGVDGGFMRRLWPIEFTHTFSRFDSDYDPAIGRKLATEKGSERFLVRAVDGMRRLMRQGGPTFSARADGIKNSVMLEGDSIANWLDSSGTGIDDLVGKKTADAYHEYREWCVISGEEAVGNVQFGRTMHNSYGLQTDVRKENGAAVRFYEEG
jgi:P4 family phage/plasmid primase-like protien